MDLKIGNIKLKNRTILAPLAGITNLPFRLIAKKGGAALVCSEMISSKGVLYKNHTTKKYLITTKEESPVSFQIFGSDADSMAEAAKIVEASGADILDINFGCTVRKVFKTGAGAALMLDPKKAEKILKRVRSAIKIPLTIKIRKGRDEKGLDALEISKIAEECGVDAITVHGRTISQKFSGKVDLDIIKKVKEHIKIPVIGNGDITSPYDALRMIEYTKCDGVMVGRFAIGRPYIFKEINFALENKCVPLLSVKEHFQIMRDFFQSYLNFFGEEVACKMMRSRLSVFIKGFKNSKEFKKKLIHVKNREEVFSLIEEYEIEFKKTKIDG